MNVDRKLSADASVEEILIAKRRARDRFIDAVYAADRADLELAAESVKALWREAAPIPRPRRFASIHSEAEENRKDKRD